MSGVGRQEATVVTLTVIGRGTTDEDMLRRTETDRLLLNELSQLNYMASCVTGVNSKQESKWWSSISSVRPVRCWNSNVVPPVHSYFFHSNLKGYAIWAYSL